METVENLSEIIEAAREEKKKLKQRVKKRTNELLQNQAAIMRLMRSSEKARLESDAANASKTEFLANMSHEIRTPMNGIIGAADMLKFTELNIDQNKFLDIISDSSKSLLNIINDILDLSKIEADKVELEMIPLDIFCLTKKTVDMLSIPAQEKGLTIIQTTTPDCPQFIIGDPTRIGQILSNLINNAIKFTKTGSVTVKLGKKDNEYLAVSITDTGIGIARDKQAEIFDSFSQSDSSTTRQYGGTGLGLTITKKLIKMMGGEIRVVSRINKGSTFSFYIKARETEENKIAQNICGASSIKNGTDIQTDKKISVLVVEDHPINMKIMRYMLNKKGCFIHEASNGQIAVEQFKKVKPDLIFMDMQMPVMDGLEATRKIRNIEKNNNLEKTIIVALTANAMTTDKDNSKKAGMDNFLAKPVTFEKLNEIIDQIPSSGTDAADRTDTIEDSVVFDYKRFTNMFSGNEGIARDLLNEFSLGTIPFMKKLDQYCNSLDYSSIEKSAHILKGQLLNMRAEKSALDFANLEKAGREKNKKAMEIYYNKCKISMAEFKNVIEQLIAK